MISSTSRFLRRLAQSQLRAFGRDAGVIMFSRLLQNANGFLLSIAIIRKFGLAAAGSLTISTIGTVVLATFLTFGLPYVFARTDAPIGARNSIGLVAALAALVGSVPVCAALGVGFGKDTEEILVIALLSLGGAFFAQTSIVNALLVLQGRAADIIFSPLGNLAGLALGYFLAHDFVTFALMIAFCRFLGAFLIFARLPMRRFSLTELKAHFRQGLRFLTADTVGLIADQGAVMIASALMTRADLGIFGLCRQMLTVSDTPLWSRLTAWYPRVVADQIGATTQLRREMLRMGVLCGLGLAALSLPLGLWIYHLPAFFLAACLMVASVPFRYVLATGEMSLRAFGCIGLVNKVTLLRCLLVAFLPAGIYLSGLYGAILASLAQAVILAWVTSRLLTTRLAHRKAAAAQEAPAGAADGGAAAGGAELALQVTS